MRRLSLLASLACAALASCAEDSSPALDADATAVDTGSDASSDAGADVSGDPVDPNDSDLLDDLGVDVGPLFDSGADAPDTPEPSDTGSTDLPMNGLFGPTIERVVVEIDYEAGAAPETGGALGLSDPFDTFDANVDALFEVHPRTVDFARTLDEMQELPDQGLDSYTTTDILAIAGEYRDNNTTATVRTFYVVWLDGIYADDNGERPNVLGVSLGNTEVIAMFKPTISRHGAGLESQVEQATLVHEFGHAVGLTNRGVPMATDDHHDEEHGAHCSNDACIMYWTVEGPDVVSFLTAGSFGGSEVMFGDACLADVQAAGQ